MDVIYIVLAAGKLRINIFTICAILLIFYLESPISALLLIAAALVHEFGHFIAMKCSGCGFKRIDVEPFGATIVYDAAKTGYRAEVMTALGGPIAGITAAAAGWLCFLYFSSPLLLMFILASILFSFVNLMPMTTLDGGVALRAILLQRSEPDRAEYALKLVSLITAAILCVFSVVLLQFTSFNISLMALTGFQIAIIFAEIITGSRNRKIAI